jgi:hypothetical protein
MRFHLLCTAALVAVVRTAYAKAVFAHFMVRVLITPPPDYTTDMPDRSKTSDGGTFIAGEARFNLLSKPGSMHLP